MHSYVSLSACLWRFLSQNRLGTNAWALSLSLSLSTKGASAAAFCQRVHNGSNHGL
jgi:hypothetical protein